MYLTNDEILDMIDCVNSRLDELAVDLTYSADLYFGLDNSDGIESEIGRLNSLMTKLNENLEVSRDGE